jgi:energy-coupling factor transporter transmembrane protein EcfT
MQEERNSLFPEKMIWSCSVSPSEWKEKNEPFDASAKWRMTLTGVVAVCAFFYMSWNSFKAEDFYLSLTVILLAYVGFINFIWWKRGAKVRNVIALIFSAMILAALFVEYVIPLF